LLDHGARFRFVSERLREALCREADARLEEASRVELPPLDLSLAPSRSSARSMLGIARAERLAVIVSRLVADKRVDLALAAANGVGFDQVVVVGDGPERQRLQRAFPSATFLGKLPRAGALAWLSAADVLVSASPAEGAPTVIREARALGVPVVAVAAGDLRRWAALDPKIHVVAG
jgi:glycosyltransferase involved in cell wall biosynthesis